MNDKTLLAKNMELQLLIQQQYNDIDLINEKNSHWFGVLEQIIEICSHDYVGLEKHALDEIKSLVKDL